MANPLSPLTSSAENIRSTQSTVRQTYRSTTSETVRREESTEDFYDVQEFANSSVASRTENQLGAQLTPNRFRSPVQMFTDWISPSQTRAVAAQPTKTIEPFPLDEDKENQSGRDTAGLKSSGVFDPDDTCASAFSMVPTADMTRFARLGESPMKVTPPRSPTKLSEMMTPGSNRTRTPGTATRRPFDASPTPRRQRPALGEDATTQLLDFTETRDYALNHATPRKAIGGSQSPRKDTVSANLLDFDLPPAPTPRSMPSISARDMEALKAGFVSQISSLKATINGKDATIQSLIDAKDDAERRQGETAERLSEAEGARTNLLEEKSDWEKRDNEIKTILRDVKSELVHRENERDEISSRLKESERAREEVEARLREADAKIAGLQADLQQSVREAASDAVSEGSKTPNKAVEIAVEKVARELHQLYKQKHESKVAALKKSYESRWEKKVRELETRISELGRENDELKLGREATMTKVVPGMLPKVETVDAGTSPRNDNDSQGAEEEVSARALTAQLQQESAAAAAEVTRLQDELATLHSAATASSAETQRLQDELETARAENSDLVAVVEEMLQLEPSSTAASGAAGGDTAPGTASTGSRSTSRPRSGASAAHTRSVSQDQMPFRASGSEHAVRPPSRSGGAAPTPKASGLARPGFGFGAPASASKGGGGAVGRSMAAAVGPAGPRSGIMSSIERMGRGRAGDGQG